MKKILVLLICIAALKIQAQNIKPSVVNSAGYTGIVAGNIHEWSIGELPAVSTITNAGTTLTQGLLQPTYAADMISGNIKDQFIVYPVPATTFVNVQPNVGSGTKLELALFDASGKQVMRKEAQLISGTELQSLDVRRLASGSYMLKLIFQKNGENLSGTWKIVKNN